jgi:hypothetical protein
MTADDSAKSLMRTGHVDELRERAAAGDTHAGRYAEAVAELRQAPADWQDIRRMATGTRGCSCRGSC